MGDVAIADHADAVTLVCLATSAAGFSALSAAVMTPKASI